MKAFNAYIIEKLKVTKGSYKTGDELFEFVMYGLKHYPEDELDVKSLNLTGVYIHDKQRITCSVDNIFFHIDWTNKGTEYMVVMLDNRVYAKIDSFKTFSELISSQTKESSEEILYNILDLLNK